MQRSSTLFFAVVLAAQHALAEPAEHAGSVFVQTAAPLDEPRGYCFDLPGHPVPNLNAPVQAHTCKEGYEHGDELFDADAARKGRLRMPAYDRCLAAVGDHLMTARCEEVPEQRWLFSTGGAIRPAAHPSQCVTIGGKSGEAGHPEEVRPPWLHREIAIEACDWRIGARQQWRLVKPTLPIRKDDEPVQSVSE